MAKSSRMEKDRIGVFNGLGGVRILLLFIRILHGDNPAHANWPTHWNIPVQDRLDCTSCVCIALLMAMPAIPHRRRSIVALSHSPVARP
jgi:hypothetical protein